MKTTTPFSDHQTVIPPHLEPFIVKQNYEKYTPRDQAVWRFIMSHSLSYFAKHAHSVYVKGLEKTGIPIEEIPHVSAMNERLQEFGWGAVCVCGFIPPLAFLEFQANRILPIAADMRTVEHLTYTPAPDIVHEAAGHAPIIADPGYREYLTRYAQMARKAIFSIEDIRLYEAIRVLSDVKENPDSTKAEIQQAELNLVSATKAITWTSEATKVTRMYWWTAEYGLIGDMQDPLLYGAGLLSSLAESRYCLTPQVKKLPFNLNCVEQSYDITEPQPQLFVAKDFQALSEVLAALEDSLSFRVGGVSSLEMAKRAATVNTVVLDNGLEISGVLDTFEANNSTITFVKWQGPVQLCYQGKELPGQGRSRHSHGFSSPLGLSGDQVKKLGLKAGLQTTVETAAGFKVTGLIKAFTWDQDHRNLLLITWQDCSVTCRGRVYFDPAWGEFDMAIGCTVPSVYGGPADWSAYGSYDFGHASSTPGRKSPFTAEEKKLFAMYQKIRDIRKNPASQLTRDSEKELEIMAETLQKEFSQEWLLGIEILEVWHKHIKKPAQWVEQLQHQFLTLHKFPESLQEYVKMGIERAVH